MKQIVIDAREIRGTGVGRYLDELIKNLQIVDTDLSHRYTVLLKPKDMDSWSASSKRFEKRSCKYKAFTFGEQLGFFWQIYRLKPDLVHFPMVQQPVLYWGRVVTTMQDLTTLRFENPSKNKYVFRFKQRVYKWVNFVAARKSFALITPSEYVKDDVARTLTVNSRKITVTYEAGDSIGDKPQPMEEFKDKEYLLYVGRAQAHKNLGRLIEAFAILKQSRPDLRLVLVGKKDALYRMHEKETKRKGIPDVYFTDFVSDGELRWLYEHCAAYVFPSLSEGFGLPPLEAMAHGAPVVSSNATCLPEINGDAAQYFDPYDVETMAKAIGEVLKKPELRKKLIKAGKVRVKTFSWHRMAEQTLDVYRQALGEK